MLWEDLRAEEFAEAREKACGVCIVPIGCVEKHGQHLPLGTDIVVSGEMARQAAEEEYAVVFPTIYFGEKGGAGDIEGTIIFSSELRFKILEETCSEIARNGFKKILFFNGHGGNRAMLDNFTRSTLKKENDFLTFTTDPQFPMPIEKLFAEDFDFLTEEDKAVLQDFADQKKLYGHGCFFETGWVYNYTPDLVRIDKMNQESGKSTGLFDVFSKYRLNTPFNWMANFPNSYTGDYHEGLNERISKAVAQYAVNRLKESIKFLKTETVSTDFQKQWKERLFD